MSENDSERISRDQAYYDQESVGTILEHEKWMRDIEYYFLSYADKLNIHLTGKAGKVAELGAGSCGLSVCLSRLDNVKKIFAVDISMGRMQKMIDMSSEILNGELSKIESVSADFNTILPFNDGELDVVLFDASLHHSRSMWHILSECQRVLSENGLLIAQRESFLSTLRAKKQLANLLKTPEVAASVSENMYLKYQYEYYLKVNGFDVNFIRRTQSRLKSFLSILNGSLFCDGVFWCEKN